MAFLRKTRKRIRRIRECSFCTKKEEPDYKNVETLKRFITDRGKIIPRIESGLCQKHQRRTTHAVKYARLVALLPFIVRPS